MQRSDTTDWKVIGDNYHTAKPANSPNEQINEMLNRDGQVNPHWHTFT